MSLPNNSTNSKVSPEAVRLDKPEKLDALLKDDRYDCFACRLTGLDRTLNVGKLCSLSTGAGAFIGAGAYVYISGRNGLKDREKEIMKRSRYIGMRGRLTSLTILSSTLVGLGLYRLIN